MAPSVLMLQATYINPYYNTAYLGNYNRRPVYPSLKYRPDLFPRSRAQSGMSSNGTTTIHLFKDVGTLAPQVVCKRVSVDKRSTYNLIQEDKAKATLEHIERIEPDSQDCPIGSTGRIHLRWRLEGSAASYKHWFFLVNHLPQGHELVLGKDTQPYSSERPERHPHPVHLGETKDKMQKDAQKVRDQEAEARRNEQRRKDDDERERQWQERKRTN